MTFYLNQQELDDAIADLQKMGPRAQKLLAEIVKKQSVVRKSLSETAENLELAGFIFISDKGDLWNPEYVLNPSLAGEEALEGLEKLRSR